MGNPKGKAVEHFSNMIAEMRSYGQGVIVAEQIPTKLAPDVIKNSSTKIVQRIVSADDQQIIANTIGISAEDALQLGTLEAGYAFCHKEGMSLPTTVKISEKFTNEDGIEQDLDVFVSDEELYNLTSDRFYKINLSSIRSVLGVDNTAKRAMLALMNTLLIESVDDGVTSCKKTIQQLSSFLRQRDTSFILSRNDESIIAEFMTETILGFLVRGVYCANVLPPDEFLSGLKDTLSFPTKNKIQQIKHQLSKFYNQDIRIFAMKNIAELIRRSLKRNTHISATITEYFTLVSPQTISDITAVLKVGASR